MAKLFAEIGTELTPAENEWHAKMISDKGRSRPQYKASEACGKVCYPTESEARTVANTRKRNGAGRLRAYLCPKCAAFHLTSYISKL